MISKEEMKEVTRKKKVKEGMISKRRWRRRLARR